MMIDQLEERISNLTDIELKQCWNEIKDYNKKGVMGDTLVREIRDEFAESINQDSWDRGCTVVTIPEILMEIARRHYDKK